MLRLPAMVSDRRLLVAAARPIHASRGMPSVNWCRLWTGGERTSATATWRERFVGEVLAKYGLPWAVVAARRGAGVGGGRHAWVGRDRPVGAAAAGLIGSMVTAASPEDVEGLVSLAAEVEGWFGPMVTDPGFHAALDRSINRGTAFVVRAGRRSGLLGGLLTGGTAPIYRLNWLVVAASVRRQGVGGALVRHAMDNFQRPCRVDVVTFGKDHPATIEGGARVFYEASGSRPARMRRKAPKAARVSGITSRCRRSPSPVSAGRPSSRPAPSLRRRPPHQPGGDLLPAVALTLAAGTSPSGSRPSTLSTTTPPGTPPGRPAPVLSSDRGKGARDAR